MKKTLLFLFFTSILIWPNQLFSVCSSSVDMGGYNIMNIRQLQAKSAVINDGKSMVIDNRTKVIIGNPSTKSCIYFKAKTMICSEPDKGLAFYGDASSGTPTMLATSASKIVINSSNKDLGADATVAVEGLLVATGLHVFNDTAVSDKSSNLYINGGWVHINEGSETGVIYSNILKIGGTTSAPVFYYNEAGLGITDAQGNDALYKNTCCDAGNNPQYAPVPIGSYKGFSPYCRLQVKGTVKFASSTNLGVAAKKCSSMGTCPNQLFITLDLAEVFPTSDFTLNKGDIISLNSSNKKFVEKASNQKREKIIGVVTTNPAILLKGNQTQFNPSDIFKNKEQVPVALAGRVPVNISLEGGPIKIGDPITISSTDGVGKKAGKSGMIVGVALENYFHKKSSNDQIMILVNTNWQPSKKDYEAFSTLKEKRDSLKAKNKILRKRLNALKIVLAQKINN